MHLETLSLLDFKNIAEVRLKLGPRMNCFVGDNGTGKTNLLDAVYYLSMCKSAFNLTDSQSARHDADTFMVNGTYRNAAGRTENVLCAYRRSDRTKKVSRNNKEYEKLSDHIGLIPIVLISPLDTVLINESGDERRRYLNSFISQFDREYLASTMRYNQLLGERNRLLKDQSMRGFDDMLDVFDIQLAETGTAVHEKRRALIEELAPVVARYYEILSSDREQVELSYKSELNDGNFADLLRRNAQKDRINQFTTGGVHRDDLRMAIGGYPLRKYGSQGQQKSFLIALKLAQYDVLAARQEQKPILLLDDVFDKLDTERVSQLISLVGQEKFGQIFITDCNRDRLHSVLKGSGYDYALFEVRDGVISRS